MAADAAAAALAAPQQEDLHNISRYKLKPPTYNGDYGTFEEWKYKFTAYMGLFDNDYPQLLEAAATAQNELTDALLRGAADTIEQDEKQVQLATDLKFLLISITTSSAATIYNSS